MDEAMRTAPRMAVQQEEAQLYPLADDSYARWTPVIALREVPSAPMQELIDATRAALESGLFYSRHVLDAVVTALAHRLTPALLERGRGRVEGGDFGMETYYARKYIEACAQREHRRAAEARLSLAPGRALGTLIFNDGKQTTSCVVTKWENGWGTLRGRRGRQTVEIRCDAIAVEYAIERYHERRDRRAGEQGQSQAALFV